MSVSTQDLPGTTRTHRRWLAFGLSVTLTSVTLYFAFRGIDIRDVSRLLAVQNRLLLVAAAFLILVQIILGGERWRAVLGGIVSEPPPSLLAAQAVFYASIFFNCLPFGTVGGDVMRIWLARRFALPLRHVVLSVLLDRILTVGALTLLAAVTLPFVPPLAGKLWLLCAAALALGAGGLLLLRVIEDGLGQWRHHRLLHFVLFAVEQLRRLIQHSGLFALCCALASGISSALAAYCIARSLDINVGPVTMIAVMSVIIFIVALPVSLSGWGVREMSVVALLSILGVNREAALILSVEFGLLGTLMSVPGGLVWLFMRYKQPRGSGDETGRDHEPKDGQMPQTISLRR